MLQRVLPTGANGYLGSHILAQLLSDPSGPLVRAVVRSQAKADRVRADFGHTNAARLSFAIVPDITTSGAFNHAFEASPSEPALDAVIHAASPFRYKAIKGNIEWLDPAVEGTTEILKATKAFTSSVQRVVITSSSGAIFGQHTELNNGKIYMAND